MATTPREEKKKESSIMHRILFRHISVEKSRF